MTALSLRQKGFQRMGAGAGTFRQALVEAGRGLYAMLSGLGLFLAGVVLTPWMWISWPFIRRAPAKADTRRWERFMMACRRLGETVLEWAVFSLITALVIGSVALALHYMDPPLRESLTSATNIIYPIAFFLALAVLYLVGWLAVRLGAALLAYLGRRLTRQGLQALAVVAAVILTGATGAVLYALLKPTPVVALIAGVAVLAGLAGFALISFGPSGIAIFDVSRGSHARSKRRGRQLHTQAKSLKGRSSQPALVARQQAVSAPPLAMAAVSVAAPAGAADPVEGRRRKFGKPWSLPRLPISRTAIMLGLAIVLALLLAWGGGELLLRAIPGNSQPGGAAVKPASPAPAPRDNATLGTGVPGVIQLSADGEPADVSWRSGYRQLTARFDDGRAVQQLALPTTACGAAAVVVFGAASSDGSAARNHTLAQRRALWLADWTRRELSQCPDPVPVVIAVSLGQAKPGLPLPAQRAVRLLAIQEEDVRNPAFRAGPQMLRANAQASFKGLDAFTRFDACIVTAHKDDQPALGWLRPCAAPQQ